MSILSKHDDIGLMLIDLIMPGFGEFEGLRLLRSTYPQIPIVIISIHDDPEYVLEAIGHGVIGYIPKSAGAEEIIRSLTRVISGEVSFPRYIIERKGVETPPPAEGRGTRDARNDLDDLTKRERGVLALFGQGTPVAKIAVKLSISPQTVRVHISNAMRKLDIKTREEMMHFAVNHARQLGGGV